MSSIFFASDHHFDHANILNFKKADGVTPLRPVADVTDTHSWIAASSPFRPVAALSMPHARQ